MPTAAEMAGSGEIRDVWSTARVDQLMEALEEGYKPKSGTPFYENRTHLRKGNIVFDYTEQELVDIKRCARDIVYFAEHFATVMTDEGLQRIKLRDYQKDMLRHFTGHRFNVCLASRQIGKTICSAIFIAWYVLFNFDKNALILANKGATTKEIIDKAKVILESLPFFLKPGMLKYDVMNMKFDNGCRIVGQATTAKSGISFTIHLLFLDEFAHIHHSFLDTFFENVYPTLSSSKVSRIIITSTPNGYNKFYDIYSAAVEGNSEFAPFRVDWWQVPGRDEAWRVREINNLGSEEAFNRQYGNQFLASSNLLLPGTTLKRLRKHEREYIVHEFKEFDNAQLDVYRFLKWHPDEPVDDLKNPERYYVMSVDIAEGTGGDYSVINVFEIVPMLKKHFHLLEIGRASCRERV